MGDTGTSRWGQRAYPICLRRRYDSRPRFSKELKESGLLPIHAEKEGRATLTINEAATVLNVSAETLRLWEERYGFPAPARTANGRDEYDGNQMLELRDALQNSRSISHAVAEARAMHSRAPQPAA